MPFTVLIYQSLVVSYDFMNSLHRLALALVAAVRLQYKKHHETCRDRNRSERDPKDIQHQSDR